MARVQNPLAKWVYDHRYTLFFALILLISVFFRFWRLNSLPPGLHPDEAANGLDIVQRIFKGDLRPLYTTNGPRESLFFFLQAIFVATLGNTILALRMAPAAIGVLTVIATYFWAKEWFGQRIALITAFIMAVNPWAVTITRDGFRASMTPLFVALTLYLYTKAFQKKKSWLFALAGFTMGTGMYSYLAFRMFPLLFIPIAIYFRFWRKGFINQWRNLLIVSIIGFLIALIPLGLYGIKHPGDIAVRTDETSILNTNLNHSKPLQTVTDVVVKTALMFNVHGDDSFRRNLGGEPELNIFVGIMFILGLLLALANFNRTPYFALCVVWGVMLLPELLTADGIPDALRSYGAIGATIIFAGIGIDYMLKRWYTTFPINSAARASGLAIMVVLLALTALHGYTQYFVAWADAPGTYSAYSEDAVGMANFLNNRSFDGDRYVIVDNYSDKTIQYLTYNKAKYTRIDPGDINKLPLSDTGKQFIVSENNRDEAIKLLKLKYTGDRRQTPYFSAHDNHEYFVTLDIPAKKE